MNCIGNIRNIVAVLLLFTASMLGQNQGIYSGQTMIPVPTGIPDTEGSLNFETPITEGCPTFKVIDGLVSLEANFGENYELGSVASLPFEVYVTATLQLETSSGLGVPIDFELPLTNRNPEGLIYIDLKPFIDETNTQTGLTTAGEAITGIKATITNVVNNVTGQPINVIDDLKILLKYEIENGIDVSSNAVTNLSHTGSNTPLDKVVSFSWQDNCTAPNYEFQLVRLFNTDPLTISDERLITAQVDWSKALSFQTESSNTSIEITIGEGQGFYVWRVRPLGTFYEGAMANNSNWGAWNTSAYAASTPYPFDATVGAFPTGETLYFVDLDDNLNYQYSRVFTEGNKQSEQLTYATPLNQVKQTQRYFPSGAYKVITQSVLDYSGRPTMSTLPVPIPNEKLNSYKEQLVTTNNGELYKAKHFDTDANFQNPSTIDIDATSVFAYYSNLNPDVRVDNAQGYPFSRIIYNNDGTTRVVEQSGVGKTHMLGNQEDDRGRTTRTLYGTPTEDELVLLFGDEAPYHENVSKIVTIDPNNTTSVSYITKEGKTIATGLTFSEDDDVLDKIDSNASNTITPRVDKVTNNTFSGSAFVAAKRLTLLEPSDVLINYTIQKQILEGLCTNLEVDMDYRLLVEIFNIETGDISQQFDIPSIWLAGGTGDPITFEVGTASLTPGSYYVQKSLIANNEAQVQVVESQENMRRLIEPYFQWLLDRLGEIDCEEELQYLYNDIYYFGNQIYLGTVGSNLLKPGTGNVSLPFDSANCSALPYTLLAKSNPDDPDEFLDYYRAGTNSEQYGIDIYYFEEGVAGIQTIDFASSSSLGNKIPVRVGFRTPCCEFDVPVNFTPPFRVPSREALAAYKYDEINPDINAVGDTQSHFTSNTSINYYEPSLLDADSYPPIADHFKPNYKFLTRTSENFTYTEIINPTTLNVTDVIMDNDEAYALDFEGYAVSMLYECKSVGDSSYEISDAQEAVYGYMRGWHKPGVLNQMVYHMVSDNYGEMGCGTRSEPAAGELPTSGSNPNGNPVDNYHICDIPQTEGKLPGAQYSVTELAECWEALVIELVNELCVTDYELQAEASDNVSDNVDDQDGAIHDDHFDDNIKNFIVRWISKRKLKRKLRSMNIGGTTSPEEAAMEQKNNIVNLFLECTGYTFADIVDPPENPGDPVSTNYPEFTHEFDLDPENGEYNRERLLDPLGTGDFGKVWTYFTQNPDPDAIPAVPEYEMTPSGDHRLIEDLIPNIFDPVYAFKYYEYEEGYLPELELMTCYRDPNLCYAPDGTLTPCCGGTVEKPDLCNFCGIGYIECPYTKEDWTCGQRYTFYDMLKYWEPVEEEDGIPITCENYYESVRYIKNPNYNIFIDLDTGDYNPNVAFEFPVDAEYPADVLNDLEYLSEDLWVGAGVPPGYIISPSFASLTTTYEAQLYNVSGQLVNASNGLNEISLIEHEAYLLYRDCDGNCDGRRGEFRQVLIKMFQDRCYVIADCKLSPDDNIVPEEDIDALVDKIVAQCKIQCPLTSYNCSDDGCRRINTPLDVFDIGAKGNNYNISEIDYGVEGPMKGTDTNPEFSNRDGNLLVFNSNTQVWESADGSNNLLSENVTSATGAVFERYYYDKDLYEYSIWNVRRSMRYPEYSRWIQSMDWLVQLDIKSKCNENGEYDPLVGNDPNYNGYVLDDTGIWVLQNFDFGMCPPDDYVTRDNPEGDGDTFVERDQYILNATDPAYNNGQQQEPVDSPKVGIKHEVEN